MLFFSYFGLLRRTPRNYDTHKMPILGGKASISLLICRYAPCNDDTHKMPILGGKASISLLICRYAWQNRLAQRVYHKTKICFVRLFFL